MKFKSVIADDACPLRTQWKASEDFHDANNSKLIAGAWPVQPSTGSRDNEVEYNL